MSHYQMTRKQTNRDVTLVCAALAHNRPGDDVQSMLFVAKCACYVF